MKQTEYKFSSLFTTNMEQKEGSLSQKSISSIIGTISSAGRGGGGGGWIY